VTTSLLSTSVRRSRRFIAFLAALVAAAGLLLAAHPGTAHALTDPATAEAQFLTLLNQARAANGQASLARDGALDGVGRDWSTHMATIYAGNGGVTIDPAAPTDCNRSALCHRPNLADAVTAASPGWLAAGENIGVGGDVQALHDGFMNSPGHRANVLGDYDRVGVGVITNGTQMWVTFDFVKGSSAPAPAPTAATRVADPAAATPVAALATNGRFTAAKPQRVVDTRSGLGVAAGAVPANGTLVVPMAGTGQVPADATGVVANVTATGGANDGYLTIYPCGATVPTSSTLNFVAGASVPNLATSGLGTNGNLCVFANVSTDVVIDLAGWYRNGSGASFAGQAPVRVLDTRPSGQTTQAATVDLKGKVPSGTRAVAVNITATQPTGAGFVTAYPCGITPPETSNVNYTAGATVANAAVVPLGADGTICLTSPAPTHLVVDLAGSFAGSGDQMTAVTPARLLDTRASIGGWLGRLGAGQTVDLAVAGRPGIPAAARSAVFNVTVTGAASDGYLTVYPCGTPVPTASNVNYLAGDTRANQVTVDLGGDGRACFYSSAPTNVVADLTGYLN
jgi:hypothetical protein